ncbi:hypothetical protein [Mycobacterium sp. 1274761.0]|uniref:hypothetical protein n=1 Tax=Mycobacterium sp. 1274761.0 TaxID=1834077 RepID=UPI000AD95DDE|nr:hypothetical protein [Mycobacterium sp. 1274761.0]
MAIINAFNGVGVSGMARALRAAQAIAAAAHPAAVITPRKPRTATAIVASVNRGTI